MSESPSARRVIEVHRGVIGPVAPRPKSVRPRKLADYPHVPAAYRDVARKLSSPLMMGPPVCDELMAFLQHLFTEEEAAVVRHLNGLTGKTARHVARAERRPLDQVEPILERLAVGKRAIASTGSGTKRYQLMPVMPGIFEMVLISESPETLSDWHRKFIELFEALYETGYVAAAGGPPSRVIRYLPVGRAIDAHPMALPSDHMESVLDRFTTFGIGQCQCRTAMVALGKGCGKPIANCTVMGQWAEQGVSAGWLKPVGKRDVLEIKREAEAHGMVSFLMNVQSTRGQASCSCCGCCCKAMRSITEFSAPSIVAPPHFLPKFDASRCTYCGKCATQCPMGALVLDVPARSRKHLLQRCIGCGVCAAACPQPGAIAMEGVPDYAPPYRNWFSFFLGNAPAMFQNAWKAWRNR